MAYNMRSLTGVGGWLAFFVITLALNAATTALASTWLAVLAYRNTTPAMRSYFEVLAAVGAACAVGHGYVAWRLVARQERRTPRIAIWGLWLLALVPIAAGLAVAGLLLGSGASAIGSLLDATAIRPIVYAGVWTAYLLNSDRVANTYAHDDHDRAAAVFR